MSEHVEWKIAVVDDSPADGALLRRYLRGAPWRVVQCHHLDEMLDTVTLYWMTGSGSSSAKLYWESFGNPFEGADLSIKIPVGYSKFPKEIVPAPKSWAEPFFENLIYYGEPEKGGHFAALEQPNLFVREVRSCFSEMSL